MAQHISDMRTISPDGKSFPTQKASVSMSHRRHVVVLVFLLAAGSAKGDQMVFCREGVRVKRASVFDGDSPPGYRSARIAQQRV